MNSRTRIWIAVCACLLLLVSATMSVADPFQIYGQEPFGGGTGSIYYIGAVVGDTCYTGQIGHSAQQWGDVQVNGTALLNKSPDGGLGNWAKCSLPLGGYIYSTDGANNMRRQSAWDVVSEPVLPVGQWSPDAICTDGTYIYGTQGSSGAGGPDTNVVYKWSINHATNTLTLLGRWTQGTAANHRFRAISYYNGKLYVANHFTTGEIYEVDPTTGAFTLISSKATAIKSHYQAVRYGDDIWVVGIDCNIYKYDISANTWTTMPTGLTGNTTYGLFGIGLKGDGTEAKYAWITGPFSRMGFFALYPFQGTATNLADPANWKQGYPVYTTGIVTAIGPVGTGFWIENPERTTGAFVAYTGTAPALNKIVTIKAGASRNLAGEKVLTLTADPDALVVGATATTPIKPVILTNKAFGTAFDGVTASKGLATDGMLVRVCGTLTGHTYGMVDHPAIYIDDGSHVPSDVESPAVGLKVCKADGLTLDDPSDPVTNLEAIASGQTCYITVTGVVRLEKVGDKIIRRIDARSSADVQITTP